MPKITFIPTPIGNLEDITLRALRTLKEVDLLAAEDTRVTGRLLNHFEIKTPMLALHQHNEHQKIPGLLLQAKEQDLHIGVVSDAGTPGISDPGYLLVREALKLEIAIETLPGATACIPALVNSGLPCDRFCFEGFLPVKKGRKKRLEQLREESRTMVFYESPFRLVKTLGDLAETFGAEREASVSREISKLHEETRRGSLSLLQQHFEAQTRIKGEIVIILAGV